VQPRAEVCAHQPARPAVGPRRDADRSLLEVRVVAGAGSVRRRPTGASLAEELRAGERAGRAVQCHGTRGVVLRRCRGRAPFHCGGLRSLEQRPNDQPTLLLSEAESTGSVWANPSKGGGAKSRA
jgi:hypothetical protein